MAALNTSGRAVFVAGITVCIALLGMFILQVAFLYGVALSAALVVALTMAASLTLLPALLGFFGMKVLRRSERRLLAEQGPQPEEPTGFWARWAKFIGGRSAPLGVVALGADRGLWRCPSSPCASACRTPATTLPNRRPDMPTTCWPRASDLASTARSRWCRKSTGPRTSPTSNSCWSI